jgi:RimJ/RimL family protein N-acetyltransferase
MDGKMLNEEMDVHDPIFTNKNVCLGPIDYEKDPEIEARWTHDPSYLRMISLTPAMPQSIAQIKQRYEEIEKSQEEEGNLYYFTLRMRQDDRLIGFGKIGWIEWGNSTGFIQLGIGNPANRLRGYGSEALNLLLHFAFAEINLYRLTATIPEYNTAGLGLFRKFGFVEEVRLREALQRDVRRWDMLHLGLLASEWSRYSAEIRAEEATDDRA